METWYCEPVHRSGKQDVIDVKLFCICKSDMVSRILSTGSHSVVGIRKLETELINRKLNSVVENRVLWIWCHECCISDVIIWKSKVEYRKWEFLIFYFISAESELNLRLQAFHYLCYYLLSYPETDCWFLLVFVCVHFLFVHVLYFVCIIFVYFWCRELWLFYVHFLFT